MFPLVLIHIPALVAYVTSEYALQDAFQRRQNACAVLDEFTKFVLNQPNELYKAVEKCKGSVKCPASFASKTLAALHDALSKNTPPLDRPVCDGDSCDTEAWNAERSVIRELFGAQLSNNKHPLTFELETGANSLAKCLRMYLEKAGNVTVNRAPLIMVCTFSSKRFIDYPFDFVFSGVKYALSIVGTPEKTMYEDAGAWYLDGSPLESMNALITKDACVVVYRRF
jgi:hypothetical protein